MEHYCFLAAFVFVLFFAVGWADHAMTRRRHELEDDEPGPQAEEQAT